ncbi:hypothetical protein MD484_g4631, partial [Candolleomyces efflorescens]
MNLPRIIIPVSSTPSLPPPEQPQASSSTAPPLPSKPGPKKRALLIGIQNIPPEKLALSAKAGKFKDKVAQKLGKQVPQEQDGEQGALRGPHQDVTAMKQVLTELYGYQESDITVLMDGDDPDCIFPTEENILKHIDELVAGAAPGDTFFFHFSGHSKQEDTDNKEEEDGKDELIVTYDDKYIRDNVLREKLVDPLPIGSHLIAVFDTCHSASLLDLEHFRCNRVWVPWTNKGKRRSMTKQNGVVRQQGRLLSPKADSPTTRRFNFPVITKRRQNRGSIEQVLEPPVQKSIDSRRRERRHNVNLSTLSDDPKTPLSPSPKNRTMSGQSENTPWLSSVYEGSPIVRCRSPEELFCSGWCVHLPNADKQFPNVISLSAAKDEERAWEDSQGCSMTQCLVRVLRKNPNPTLHDLLLTVSHDLHGLYLDIHAKSRDYKKKVRTANLRRIAKGLLAKMPELVEMDNFQNPQVHIKLVSFGDEESTLGTMMMMIHFRFYYSSPSSSAI